MFGKDVGEGAVIAGRGGARGRWRWGGSNYSPKVMRIVP